LIDVDKYFTRPVRKWLYGISLAGVPLLVAYGAIDDAAAPLWIALAGSVLAPTLALTHMTPEESDER
jgi:hypothetical protein